MPYTDETELPPDVAALPKDARAAWISVFNSTFRTFPGSDEEKHQASSLAAWTAINTFWKKEAAPGPISPAGATLSMISKQVAIASRTMKFTTDVMEASEQITFGEVYIPWDVDAHGDFTSPEVIQKAAYQFMARYQDLGVQHKGTGGKGIVVESFISRPGDRDFKTPGSWVLGVKWGDPEWHRIRNGELLGFSLDGIKTFVPVLAGAEMVKSASLKADAPQPEGALIDDVEAISTNPRVIKLMTDLEVMRVDGVSLPANRQQWKLYKSIGGAMQDKIVRVAPALKLGPGGPYQKLYDELIAEGLTPEQALEEMKRTLPEPPGGWETIVTPAQQSAKQADPVVSFEQCSARLDELMSSGIPASKAMAQFAQESAQAEQAASTQNGILKQIAKGIGTILTRLGAAKETETIPAPNVEATKEDDPMSPAEKQEINDRFAKIEAMLEKIANGGAPKEASAVPVATPAAAPAPVAAVQASATDAYAPTPEQAGADLLEIAGTVLELKSVVEKMQGNRGRSSVQEIINTPVTTRKVASESEPVYSQIVGGYLPGGARESVIDATKARMEKKRERRKERSGLSLRMG